MSDTPTGRRVCAHADGSGRPHLLEVGQTCQPAPDLRPRVHWQDWYDPVARNIPFGLFPHSRRYQDFRQWRETVAVPAIRSGGWPLWLSLTAFATSIAALAIAIAAVIN